MSHHCISFSTKLSLTLIISNNSPFPSAQPIPVLTPSPPAFLRLCISLPLSPFIKPNRFVMVSLGKLCSICCHSLNEFICLCIGHGSITPSLPCPPFFLVFPRGLHIYSRDHFRRLLFLRVPYRQMPCITVRERAQRVSRRETEPPDHKDVETLQTSLVSITSASSSFILPISNLFACCQGGLEV